MHTLTDTHVKTLEIPIVTHKNHSFTMHFMMKKCLNTCFDTQTMVFTTNPQCKLYMYKTQYGKT